MTIPVLAARLPVSNAPVQNYLAMSDQSLNAVQPLGLLRQAEARQVERNTAQDMREIGAATAENGLAAGADTALRSGQLDIGTKMQSMGIDRQAKLVDLLGRGAERAQTPEQWATYIGSLERAFGPEMVAQYRDFSARPSAMTAYQKATLAFKQLSEQRAREDHQAALAYRQQQMDLARQQADQRAQEMEMNQRLNERKLNLAEQKASMGPPLSATDRKAIMEADELAQSSGSAIDGLQRAIELSKKAYSGALANESAWLTSQFGNERGVATRELNNIVTEQALSSLKAIFGGMPTEGERKILLELQGTAEQPADVRARILDRALELAKRRQAFYQDRAQELRSGGYYKPGGGAVQVEDNDLSTVSDEELLRMLEGQ